MSEYDKIARELQSGVRNAERSSVQEYDPVQMRQAVVHGREDIVLLVAHLSSANEQLTSINKQLTSIRRLLLILVVLLVALLIWG
jgi:hypothetical protein